jgi:hypothetical protein
MKACPCSEPSKLEKQEFILGGTHTVLQPTGFCTPGATSCAAASR